MREYQICNKHQHVIFSGFRLIVVFKNVIIRNYKVTLYIRYGTIPKKSVVKLTIVV